jgi:hypothetical protein
VDLWRFSPSRGFSPVTRNLASYGEREKVIIVGVGRNIELR